MSIVRDEQAGCARTETVAPSPRRRSTEAGARGAPAAFEVDGEVYVPAGDATRVLLEAGLTPSGAYQRLRAAAKAGRLRTAPVSPRHVWYHLGDVRELTTQDA